MTDWLSRETSHTDRDHPRWIKYFETSDTLEALFHSLTRLRIPNAGASFFGERGLVTGASIGMQRDRGDSKFAEAAAAIWICSNVMPLFAEVATALTNGPTETRLDPPNLISCAVEVLKTETLHLSSENQARYLAKLMVAIGVGLNPADTDWFHLARELVLLQTQAPPRLETAVPLVPWALDIETVAVESSIDDRRQSLTRLLDEHPELIGFDLNRWAYLLLRLELFRAATPMARWAFEQAKAPSYFPLEVRSQVSPEELRYYRAAAGDTYGWALCYEGRPFDALPLFRQALEPLNPGADDWCEVQYHRAHAAASCSERSEMQTTLSQMKFFAENNFWTHQAMLLLGDSSESSPRSGSPQYDVVISFAGKDRSYAKAIANRLADERVSVFYDDFERATLWGQDLYQYLTDVYQTRGKYCVVLVSRHYAERRWTKLEFRAAQARAFIQDQPYILPVQIDGTQLPGLLPTTGYLSLQKNGIEGIVQALLKKLQTPRFT